MSWWASGGALGAVPIARHPDPEAQGPQGHGRARPARDRGPLGRRASIGVWVALFGLALILFLVRPTAAREQARHLFAGCGAVALLQFAAFASPLSPWRALGDNHLLHHAFLWFYHGARASALPLLLFASPGSPSTTRRGGGGGPCTRRKACSGSCSCCSCSFPSPSSC
jgi:hypothetical protein